MTKTNLNRVESTLKHLEAAYKHLEKVNKGYNDQYDQTLMSMENDLMYKISILEEIIKVKKES